MTGEAGVSPLLHPQNISPSLDWSNRNSGFGNIATITLDGAVIGKIDPQLARQVQHFVEINRAVLLDYWHYRIDTNQLQQRLQSI
jgi:hypothetical protein